MLHLKTVISVQFRTNQNVRYRQSSVTTLLMLVRFWQKYVAQSFTLFLFMPWFRAASHQASCCLLYWSTNIPLPQAPADLHLHCSSPNRVRLPTLYTSSHHKTHALLYVRIKCSFCTVASQWMTTQRTWLSLDWLEWLIKSHHCC